MDGDVCHFLLLASVGPALNGIDRGFIQSPFKFHLKGPPLSKYLTCALSHMDT